MNKLKRTLRIGLMFGLIALSIPIASPFASRFVVAAHASLSAMVYGSSDWSSWAAVAWKYYAPGVGVNSGSGLHRANLAWGCFADWDLGSYIYATIYARKLNLISDGSGSGDWQFNDRINKILNWLQNRPLASGGWPYLQYTWDTGQPCWGAAGTGPTDPADSGRLLAALYALRNFAPTFTSAVNAAYTRGKAAYDTMGSWAFTGDYYGYLAGEGFAAWSYNESALFNSIDSYSGSYVTVYGQSLPAIGTVAESVNHILLEKDMMFHLPSSTFLNLAGRVKLAQEGRYSSTGSLTAWTEGGYAPDPGYIYEVIVDNDGSTWVMKDCSTPPSNTNPVCDQSTHPPLAYTKIAFSYLALYGENAYTLALVNAAKNLATSNGFGEATLENGQTAHSRWRNQMGFYSDKTNEFILAAANHAQTSATTATALTTTAPSTSSTSTTMIQDTFLGILLIMIFSAFLLILVIRRFSGKRIAQSKELGSNSRFLP